MPQIIAHRGVPRERRENTLPSFALALEAGATGIELDVHATRDGVVVVHHDPVVRALPDGSRPAIAALSLAELAALAPSPDDRIPSLTEVLALVGTRATVYVEVKASGIEERVVDVIAGVSTECAVHSFDHRVVRRTGRLAPPLRLGILQTSYLIDPVRAMRDAGALDLWQQWELIDRELVERVHAAGGRVIAWTINDPARAGDLADIGVDGLCTDVPARLVTLAD